MSRAISGKLKQQYQKFMEKNLNYEKHKLFNTKLT